MNTFSHNYFLGYINEVTPQYVKVHFPSSNLLDKFLHQGIHYAGGNVGNFIVIEGEEYGFLARIIELNLPNSERIEISEKAIHHDETDFHPSGKAELLLSFSVFEPQKTEKTVSKYPSIGAKVYACSDEQIEIYVKEFGKKEDKTDNVYAEIGKLTSNDAKCHVSLNALFGRHCAVVGTTGGGKSWTVAKLIESIIHQTDNKIILIDATGEYSNLTSNSIDIGNGVNIFHYSQLTIDELYYLLKPSSKTQVPKLMEAIRSLKIVKILQGKPLEKTIDALNKVVTKIENDLVIKKDSDKRPYEAFYYKNIQKIEDKYCDFCFEKLPYQITQECIWDSASEGSGLNRKEIPTKWGGRNDTDVSYCVSLISRVNNLLCTDEYNKIFGFKTERNDTDLTNVIDNFITTGSGILRINFANVSFDFQVREILVNAIGKYLLSKARNDTFVHAPIIVVMDEAHQFLNKSIKDEYFEAKQLDAFDLIAKECRKYGLFLCLATQMPRDIPIGTLSQMGSFIVHRLINELDKKAIENAASSANRSALSFLPILGEGEALLIGVDFPMPLLIKVNAPNNKPESNTPRLTKKGAQ